MEPFFFKKTSNIQKKVLVAMLKYHEGRFYAGNVPQWHHLARVSRVLEVVLTKTKEGTAKDRQIVVLAALCHDSLEDTNISKNTLEQLIGKTGLEYVEGMTNSFGDKNLKPYIQQVVTSKEQIRLIKLADLYDNCSAASYTMFELRPPWIKKYFLPIVTPMITQLTKTRFEEFSNTGELLKNMVEISYDRLLEEYKRQNR